MGETTIPESALPSVLGAAAGKDPVHRRVVTAPLAYAVTADDNGALIQAALDGTVVSLPTGLPRGFSFTLQNTGADAAALVSASPAAPHAIKGTVVGAARVQSSGALDKDWRNTKATAEQGDYTDFCYDGGTAWWITGGTGVWVSEA